MGGLGTTIGVDTDEVNPRMVGTDSGMVAGVELCKTAR
jgi:hypothetical protein